MPLRPLSRERPATWPLSRLLATLLAMAAASPAWSETPDTPGLREALSAAAAGDTTTLQRLMPRLARDDQSRRREFVAASHWPLPAKAQDRLRRTMDAYERGQGRLVRLLRELTAPSGTPGLSAAREATELLDRIEAASLRDPISAGELKVRAPQVRARDLAGTAEPQTRTSVHGGPEESSEPPIGTIPRVIREAAAALSGPVEVHEWVRNAIRPEFYSGEMKGPLQTFLEQSGNDVDTAGVLIFMLRAKGIPARYVRGSVEVPAAVLTAVTGTSTIEQAVRVLGRAGIPHATVTGGAGVASVRMERVWAEAYLPYANYRGAVVDGHGKTWVPLDAGFKRLEAPSGVDVVATLGFDPRETLDLYLAGSQESTPLAYTRNALGALLAAQRPDLGYTDVLNRRILVGENLGILPSSLPYKVIARSSVGYEVSEDLRHTLRVVGSTEQGTILDVGLPVAQVLGRRLTLAYVPLTAEDEVVARLYGGIVHTPPYLIEVRPVVRLGGVEVGSGTGGIGMAMTYTLRLDFETPGGTEAVTNRVLAGNLTAVGLGGRRVTGEEQENSQAAQILSSLAWGYLDAWNRSDEELSALFRVVPVRPTASACLLSSHIQVAYADGDPQYPLNFDWKGILIDADLRSTAPVGVESRQAERAFLLLSGLEGSILENRIFEDTHQITSISTAKALGLAPGQGLGVHDLTTANVEEILADLPFDAAVEAEIREGVARGYLVRVPAGFVSLLDWSGIGYLVLDEETGEAAYQLLGGHSGGETAVPPSEIPPGVRDPLQNQGESPVPGDVVVTRLERILSTDFQEGVVNQPLARSFRVLAMDENGAPVPLAPVAFTVIGGGGLLEDPTGPPTPELTVFTDERGLAEARLILGRSTSLIPRFLLLEGDEHATQVGLNVVAARSGAASVPGGFSAWGFPDDRWDGQQRYANLKNLSRDRETGAATTLAVAALMAIGVEDPFGNPLSNIPVRVAYRPLPYFYDIPASWSRLRGLTTTPGKILKPADYIRCLANSTIVVWGECAGEAEELVLRSSVFGVFAYPITGDSPGSWYRFEAGTAANLSEVNLEYGTWGLVCKSPNPAACGLRGLQPRLLPFTSARPTLSNRLGNMVEAYPTGGIGAIDVTTDALVETERILRQQNEDGSVYFTAEGTNQYRRVKLLDSQVMLTPATPGTEVFPLQAAGLGQGLYRSQIRMASVPQLNTVRYDARLLPFVVPYLASNPNLVDPAYVTDGNPPTVRRIQEPQRPIRSEGTFSLWGIRPLLTGLQPSPVLVGPSDVVARDSVIVHRIDPPEYQSLLDGREVLVEMKRDDVRVLASTAAEEDAFRIPQGLPLPAARYTGHLTVLGVSTNPVDIAAPPLEIAACRLLDLETPVVRMSVTRDPTSDIRCGAEGRIAFQLCRDARVTLQVDGQPLTAIVDGGAAPVAILNLPLTAGRHLVSLPPGFLGDALSARVPFEITASDLSDPGFVERLPGELRGELLNRAVLPLGHVFVKAVDLLDGHLVRSETDLEIPGRHLGLALRRTYSSAGQSPGGALGAGWSWTYAAQISLDSCGLVTLNTPESSQVFRTTDGGATFTPQLGYHGRLVRNADGSFDYTDKAGLKHHFGEPETAGQLTGPRRLEYIEEPHGDRVALAYDEQGRLAKVAETHRGLEVRSLELTHVRRGGFERIARVESAALDLRVDYEYDDRGNLIRVARDGRNVDGPGSVARVEEYTYSSTQVRDRHQLTSVTDPNGRRTEYRYFSATDEFPGEGSGGQAVDKEERVKEVREAAGTPQEARTSFQYDVSEVAALRWRTTVRDARGNDTVYVLNSLGNALEIRAPLGKATLFEWSAHLKRRETDALGRTADYGYDAQGNLVSERITTADLGVVETVYAYGPFNKLAFKRDAEGWETSYQIDPERGDLLVATDAVGNVTSYSYDEEGRLLTVTNPRLTTTTYADHDSFGNARAVTDPLGNSTIREYDGRGRFVRESDAWGRERRIVHDGLDRPVSVVRVAGGDSDDEVTLTEYFPGGQVRRATNANGAITETELDGLNRVKSTRIQVGSEIFTTATEYDGNGNRTVVRDRRGVRRVLTYDALDRLTKVEIVSGVPGEGPLGEIATFAYDRVGNKVSETDVAQRRTDFEYDGLYRLRRKLLPESSPSARYFEDLVHDRVGNRVSSRDANGNLTTFIYDGLNRLLRTTNALGYVTTVTYADPEGGRVNKSEEHDVTRGLRTTWLHDALNRETRRQVRLEGAGGAGEAYTTTTSYEDAAHAMTVTDPRGTAIRSRLNGLDQVVEEAVDPSGLNLVTRMAYDGLGNRKEVLDPEGHRTRFEHDGLGRLVRATDALGGETVYTYDGEGLKRSETDRRGVRRELTHDNLGRPRKASVVPSISSVPWSQETRYLDPQRKRQEVDARGKATTLDLDGLGRVVRTTDPVGATIQATWDGVNKRTEADKRGHTTAFEYDALNRPIRTTDPAPFQAQSHQTSYDDTGNRVVETDRRGIVKVTQSDPLGRVVSVSRAGVVLERHRYDGNGNRSSTLDAEDRQTRFTYDPANRLVARTDGEGTPAEATTTFSYDRDGNRTLERDARSAANAQPFSLRRLYDALHRVETETNGEGEARAYGYDTEGNRTLVREPEGQATAYMYDELGKLIRVTQPGGLVTSHDYDPARNRTRQTDANGHVVEMAYDDLNRLVTMTQDPGGLALTTTHAYDENGNERLLTDAKGQTVTSTYDELNRLKTKAYAFAVGDGYRPWRHTTGIEYAYDPNDNLISVDEAVASGTDPPVTIATTRTYDDLGRLSSETTALPDGGSHTVSYTHFRNGARRSITGPTNQTTSYAYDGQNRLATATNASGTTSYIYEPDGLLKEVAYPNGVTASHVYDKADRVTSVVNRNGAAGPIVSRYDYVYDHNGNRLRQVETNGGLVETTAYTYDDLNRLLTVTYPADAAFPEGRRVAYGYDSVGNRTSELTTNAATSAVLTSTVGVFDTINRLTRLTDNVDSDQSVTFGYDANGNQTSKTFGGLTTVYRYDVRDKLVEASQGASILGRFQYDCQGRRSKKIGAEGVRQYIYDQTSLFAEFDETGLQKARYEYGSDRLISLTRADEGRRFYSLDGLRSVVNLTDDSGTAVATYHLDAWGNFRFPEELNASRNRMSFTGYIWDPELGLFNAKARFYDPAAGRFTSQDSYLGSIDDAPSLHRYLYANANPARFVDLSGHDNAEANALARALGPRIGALASDRRPAHERGWWYNAATEVYRDLPPRLIPMRQLEGLANQDPSEFAKGTLETAVASAVPTVVREGGGAILARLPRVAETLGKDVLELGGAAVRRSKVALESWARRLKGSSPPSRTLEPVIGMGEPLPAIPGTSGGTMRVSGGSQGSEVAARPAEDFNVGVGIRTPHTVASQSTLDEAIAARPIVEKGAPVYRLGTLGESQAAEAQYWALEHPFSAGFAERYGIPEVNIRGADFVEVGRVRPDSEFVTRVAPGTSSQGVTNKGGAIEVVVRPGGVRLQSFHVRENP
jgi:RHS repeat-associated protein